MEKLCMEWMMVVTVALLGKCCDSKGFYVDNGMGQSIPEFLSLEDQSLMQEEILTLLGLSHVPSRRPHHSHSGLNDTQLSIIHESDVIMSFGNHGRQEDLQWTRLFWFDTNELPRDPNSEAITSSLLRLYKQKGTPPTSDDAIKSHPKHYGLVKVYQLVEGSTKDANLLDSLLVSYNEQRWISLDVTNALHSWQKDYKTNQGLMVEIRDPKTDEQIHPDSIGIVGSRHSLPDREGFMVAFLKHNEDPIQKSHRVKRSSKKKIKKNHRKYSYLEDDFISDVYRDFYGGDTRSRACQKRSLFVSFKDLGWQDWIIAPEGYAAYYCHGECTFPLNTNIPRPCCAPVQLSGISVLYFDESTNVILKKFRNMVVKTCGCH
ncbi:unnamed protein product [Lepeophtheirus salmonis]|uniref:(salmon louse) hypothetical protein n=1 Tax=Lepeophtheirus salmonis TaxID=72036 RepID=A0A7R8CXS6_LEPSM|nr:unnamed protein product [Lepeophtheirus salmonis]CAF2965129.1 unnamed protein product [Lepeophtheirus salmonis]